LSVEVVWPIAVNLGVSVVENVPHCFDRILAEIIQIAIKRLSLRTRE